MKVAEDLSAGPVPVLFLMDELLSGTNSHDRLEGTKLVVRSLMDRGAIGIVSTHDLALAEIPATMDGRAVNCHFEDRLEDGRLVFDYKLKPGVVKTSNALELMRSIGLGAASESVRFPTNQIATCADSRGRHEAAGLARADCAERQRTSATEVRTWRGIAGNADETSMFSACAVL